MSNDSSSVLRQSWHWPLTAVIGACMYLSAGMGATAEPTVREAGSADAVALVEKFSEAIATGDLASARALLLPGVLIFESGESETSAEDYSLHHLPADIAFMKGVRRSVVMRRDSGNQSMHWVATQSRLSGHYRGKRIDLDSTETIVLAQTGNGWRIAHAHWSSSPHHAAQ